MQNQTVAMGIGGMLGTVLTMFLRPKKTLKIIGITAIKMPSLQMHRSKLPVQLLGCTGMTNILRVFVINI